MWASIYEQTFIIFLHSNASLCLPEHKRSPIGDRNTLAHSMFFARQHILSRDRTKDSSLFEFIEWVDYCYGTDYEERYFDETLIPREKVVADTERIKEQESLLDEKDAEIDALRKKIEEMSAQYEKVKLCKTHRERIDQESFLL